MSPDRRVLFVSHDASRTGAPILLLNFLRWLKGNTDIPFDVLLREGGDLKPEFEALAPVFVVPQPPPMLPRPITDRIAWRWLARLARTGSGPIYSNTATNGQVLGLLTSSGRPVLSHVHELEMSIRFYGYFDEVRRHTKRYIACSGAVKENLVDAHHINPDVIDVVHECVPAPPSGEGDLREIRNKVFATLGIPVGSVVVGASGTTDWRKAPDIFIALAAVISRMRPSLPVHFIWVGGHGPSTYRYEELQYDIRKVGLQGRIHFVGSQAAPVDFFRAFDVFAMVSREDPFPLVCLEAAAQGKPIVCFDDAGGEKEFVEDDCGFVVPYLDVAAMAEKVIALLECGDLRSRLGGRARDKVFTHYTVDVIAPKLARILERCF